MKAEGKTLRFDFQLKEIRKFGVILPSLGLDLLSDVGLQSINEEDCKSEDDRKNERPSEEQSVLVSGFIFAVISIGVTGNRAGKTSFITVLENNCDYDKYCGYKEYYHKKKFHNQKSFLLS